MSDLVRVSVSLEQELLDRLEVLMEQHSYANRSEFVRDLIRDRLVAEEWEHDQEVVGTINIVSEHHDPLIRKKLVSLLHDHKKIILSTTHFHLDPEPTHCIDIILFRSTPTQIRPLYNEIQQIRGILHATLSMNSTNIKNSSRNKIWMHHLRMAMLLYR